MAPPNASEEHVFDEFDRWLYDKLEMFRPQYAFVEDTFMPQSSYVAQRLYGLRAIAMVAFHRHGVRLRLIPTSTVQLFMTGRGKWPKGEKKAATMRACQKYGWNPTTDNEGDALALWLFGEHAVAPHTAGQRSMGPIFAKGGKAA